MTLFSFSSAPLENDFFHDDLWLTIYLLTPFQHKTEQHRSCGRQGHRQRVGEEQYADQALVSFSDFHDHFFIFQRPARKYNLTNAALNCH